MTTLTLSECIAHDAWKLGAPPILKAVEDDNAPCCEECGRTLLPGEAVFRDDHYNSTGALLCLTCFDHMDKRRVAEWFGARFEGI